MNRMQVLGALSFQLRDVARYARDGSSAVSDYFILYLRQVVRYHCRYWRDGSAGTFGDWLAVGPHFYNNLMLRAMDKDRQPGDEVLKARVVDCILGGQVISAALFKEYRQFFKLVHLEGPDHRRYNTDLVAQSVGEAFLLSLDTVNGIEVSA